MAKNNFGGGDSSRLFNVLTGCSNKVSFKFRGGHVDIQEYPEYLQSEVLVNSLEDLNAFRNSAGWLGDETVDAQKSDARLNEVLDGYDRQYFSNNSLVIIVKKWSTNIEPIKRVEVKKLTKEKNSLVIDLDVLFNDANLLLPEGENKHFVCILEIERDELGEIDALTVRYNKKQWSTRLLKMKYLYINRRLFWISIY